MNEIAFPEKPLQADLSGSQVQKKFPVANTSIGKIFRLVLVEEVPQVLKKNYERYRFSRKTPTGRYTVLKMQKNIARVANTLLGKIIRLVLVEKVPQSLKKNYERNRFSGKAPPGQSIGLPTPKKIPSRKYFVRNNFSTGTCRKIGNRVTFPEKPLQADISCSELEKKSQSRKYFVRKIFRLIRVEKVTQGLKKNYERNRFSGKSHPCRSIGLPTPKKIPRVANTSLGKIFRLVFLEEVPHGLKKNYERYRFSGKTPTGRYTVLKMQNNITRVANTSLGKIFRLLHVEEVPQGLKNFKFIKIYERYRFSGETPTGRYTVLKMPTNITIVANTLLRKIFRLIRVEMTHHELQKNYERNGFSGKAPPSRYIGLRTPKKIPSVANTSLGKIFRLVLVGTVP